MSSIQQALTGYLQELLTEPGSPTHETNPLDVEKTVPTLAKKAPRNLTTHGENKQLALPYKKVTRPPPDDDGVNDFSKDLINSKQAPAVEAAVDFSAKQAQTSEQSSEHEHPVQLLKKRVDSKPSSAELVEYATPTELEGEKKAQLQKLLAKSAITTEKNPVSYPQERLQPKIEPAQEILPQVTVSPPPPATSAPEKSAGAVPPYGDLGRPQWAENEFEALLFDVAGLSLAVPLVTLGQIVPFSDKLTVLQGQSDWFMGILPTPIGDIRTVNTALFVMPDRYNERFLDSVKYVVTINNLPWGLAVDTVNQPVKLHPDDVKWRSSASSKRPWLAGTVRSYMCTLIDVPRMATMLEESDKNRAD